MIRTLRRLLAVLLMLACAPAAAAAAPRLTELGDAAFPERSYLLTVPPGTKVSPDRVQVRENRRPVRRRSVTPLVSLTGATVLVIDVSRSMRGRPIAKAIIAARSFAQARARTQRVGLVTFAERSSVLLEPTSDSGRIKDALAREPKLARGTHAYDAVAAALRMLDRDGADSGSIVLLSDGADTGSRIGGERVARAARAEGVRIFTVGVRSGAFDSRSLQRLARGTGGEYAEGPPSELPRIYRELALRLAAEHVITYRSTARPGHDVMVEVSVAGAGSATTGYAVPRPPGPPPTAPFKPSLAYRFWTSPIAMALFGLACAALAGLSLVLVAGSRRDRGVRKRLAAFVPVGEDDAMVRVTERTLSRLQRAFEGRRWWETLSEEVEIARIETPLPRIVAGAAAGTVIAGGLLFTVSGNVLMLLVGFAVPVAVRSRIAKKLADQRKAFAAQLPENLQVVASALRAGHSLVGALSVMVGDAAEPARGEFERVVADERLGVPLEVALRSVARRMGSRDLEQVALVASLQRETGGNTAEVLDRVTENVRERAELRRRVEALTAQGRLSRIILTVLAPALLVFLTITNPDYVDPLYTTGIGRTLLLMAFVSVAIGSWAIKRIVEIEV